MKYYYIALLLFVASCATTDCLTAAGKAVLAETQVCLAK